VATNEPRHGASDCADYTRAAEISRRGFLGGVAAGAGLGVAATAFGGVFRQVAFADTVGNNVLVVVSLRGGIESRTTLRCVPGSGWPKAR
jgi:uncharacterized protein (DUF1501 family)